MAPRLRRSIAEGAERNAAAAYLSDARSRRAVDRRALAVAVDAWAGELAARGVGPGARVLLDVADPLAFAVAHLAVVAAGRCSVPVDPDAPPAEAERVRLLVAPSAVLSDRAERPGVVVAEDGLPAAPVGPPCAEDAGPGSVLLLTSGSTGAPKAVALTEAQCLHVASAVATHHLLAAADRGFCPLPLFHVNAQVVGLLATLVAGGELVLERRFRRTGFWELLADRAVTWVNAAPAILTILARDPAEPRVPPGLRFVRSASAPLPPAVRAEFVARTGLPVVESYGMTEAASQITATALGEPHRPGSVGRPVGAALRVVDGEGRPCAAGVVGRVRIRGAGVIRAYAGGAAADRFDADGWLDTADLGSLDADGHLYLSGRADDVVNRGGELVHPREVEEVLLGDPAVVEAVVAGRPHEVLGAVPVALVRTDAAPAEGAGELVGRLGERCARELAAFKRPVEIRVVARFPVGPTGKVRRAAVRAGIAAEAAS
jgi:acyl-CoA synthetase (AMP-forming)/AMP-acid ligase II